MPTAVYLLTLVALFLVVAGHDIQYNYLQQKKRVRINNGGDQPCQGMEVPCIRAAWSTSYDGKIHSVMVFKVSV